MTTWGLFPSAFPQSFVENKFFPSYYFFLFILETDAVFKPR